MPDNPRLPTSRRKPGRLVRIQDLLPTPPGEPITIGKVKTYVDGLVTFLSKAEVAQTLASLPAGSRVEIDGRGARHIDYDILELITNFRAKSGRSQIA